MNPPAFQFYADDFIGGTCDLSAEEVGTYIRLLCYQWTHDSLPIAPLKVNRIAGAKVSADVMAKFPNGKNARLETVRENLNKYRENRKNSGKAGAEKRWHSHSTAMQQPIAKNSSPSPSLNIKKKEPLVIPEKLNTPHFQKAWCEWLIHLHQKRKPPTELAKGRQLAKLEAMGEEKAIATLAHCIEKNWQGIYEATGLPQPILNHWQAPPDITKSL